VDRWVSQSVSHPVTQSFGQYIRQHVSVQQLDRKSLFCDVADLWHEMFFLHASRL